jgi:hypothetical protein
MMEDLSADWIPFDPLFEPPTFEQTVAIMGEVAKMHKVYYKSPEAALAPFSWSGSNFQLPDFAPFAATGHAYKTTFLKDMPEMMVLDKATGETFADRYNENKYPWPASYTPMCDLHIQGVADDSKLQVELFNKCVAIMNTRYGARFSANFLHSRMPLDPTPVRLKRTCM